MKRHFYIKTLGCKVNQYESQVIRERFLKNGYLEAENVNEAEIYVVNTCTVTSNSDSKSLRIIHNARKGNSKCVIATGCMVETDGDTFLTLKGTLSKQGRGHFPSEGGDTFQAWKNGKLGKCPLSCLESVPYSVDFIVKNRDKYSIPEIVDGLPITDYPLPDFSITKLKGHTRVFVKVQDGCDNVCSYCKVRIARGHSRSRPLKEVLEECRTLIRNGTKELVLTGICLGAFGKDISKELNLARLVEEICNSDGDCRLRLSSIEPKDINDDLIRQLETQKRLCKHLHIPFQSGDDYVLKKMDRPYKRSDYLNIVSRLKNVIPDIAITTDIMVGFPGETEENFHNTLDFVEIIQPMRMHIFPYSQRKGTKAYNYGDSIGNIVQRQREDKLLSLAKDFSKEFVKKFVKKSVEVLVEDKRSKDCYLQGYTDRYIKIFIEGQDSLKGSLVNCQLTLTNGKVCGILPLHYLHQF